MIATARVVAYTVPTPALCKEIPEAAGPGFIVGYCARVSNPKNQGQPAAKLLAYLLREKHFSPFEMENAVLEIECPRDIARQLLRHRSFTFQEFSQRYAAALAFVRRDARRQDMVNRQNSTDDLPRWKRAAWDASTWLMIRYVALIYAGALRLGMAKETARTLLPEGMTMSRLYVNGTLRSWIHYLQVRKGNGTQLEHVMLAGAIEAALAEHYPDVFAINSAPS